MSLKKSPKQIKRKLYVNRRNKNCYLTTKNFKDQANNYKISFRWRNRTQNIKTKFKGHKNTFIKFRFKVSGILVMLKNSLIHNIKIVHSIKFYLKTEEEVNKQKKEYTRKMINLWQKMKIRTNILFQESYLGSLRLKIGPFWSFKMT